MAADDGYEALIEELVAAIELRETGDVDGLDGTLGARIRRLECELMTAHRLRPGRWRTADALLDRLGVSREPRVPVGPGRGVAPGLAATAGSTTTAVTRPASG